MKTPRSEIFTWPVRVYWEDTDAGGIVFYANYLKFFERSRTEWLRSKGIDQHQLRETTGGMFVVSHAEISYLKSAKLDDLLSVSTRLIESGRAFMRIHQQAFLHANEGQVLLCEGSIRAAWVNASQLKPARIPQTVLDALT
jgi:acyl-CoA thioester hydrolase